METLQVIGYVEGTHITVEARLEKGLWYAYQTTPRTQDGMRITDPDNGNAIKAESVLRLVVELRKAYPHWKFYPEKGAR